MWMSAWMERQILVNRSLAIRNIKFLIFTNHLIILPLILPGRGNILLLPMRTRSCKAGVVLDFFFDTNIYATLAAGILSGISDNVSRNVVEKL